MVAVLALLLAAIWLQHGPVTAAYDNVPVEVVDVRAFEWSQGGVPEPIEVSIERRSDRLLLTALPRSSVVVTFVRRDGAYLIDAPAQWSSTPRRTLLGAQWRHTQLGAVPTEAPAGAAVEWTPVIGDGPWPRCFVRGSNWECWGVRPEDRGVVTMKGVERLWWAAALPRVDGPLRQAAWGRLLVVGDSFS